MQIAKIGVVGAGQMGNGIAQVCAQSGYDVVMLDVSDEALERGLATINSSLDRLIKKGTLAANDRDALLGRLKTTTAYSDFGDADMVIEAATEYEPIKFEIFRTLNACTRPEAILASNTSSISITRIAAQTKRPELVIGMHFMNPVPLMQLVEVIRGYATADATYQATEQLARALGKTPVEVNDYPGFIANRILMPMINEAIFALYEGVANREAIDSVMKLGMNHPMGPLTLADFIGLDTCLAIMEVLHRGMGDDKYRPCPLLRNMVAAGHLGKKTGRGFYEYAAK
ncbi:MAG TPA: 3-hydroxybutyryl-CoA dehydrogenase [Herpetosiphonaceae bacterium]